MEGWGQRGTFQIIRPRHRAILLIMESKMWVSAIEMFRDVGVEEIKKP